MQGKNAYVVFIQTTNESWYVTCLAQGTRTGGETPSRLVDKYKSELGQVAINSVLYDLSKDKAEYTKTFSKVKKKPEYVPALLAWEMVTEHDIWKTYGARYGWEVSKRVKLPRGFKFVKTPPSTVRFKPNGTTCDVKGNFLGDEHDIEIREETRTNHIYTVRFNMNGSTEVIY